MFLGYIVAVIVYKQFMVHVIFFPQVKCLYFYITTILIIIMIMIIIIIIIINKEFNLIIFHVTFKWKRLLPSLLALNFSDCNSSLSSRISEHFRYTPACVWW